VGLGRQPASSATVMVGVDIEWDHGDADQSRNGAKEMIDGFDLAVPPASVNAPALDSNHIAGTAIDMDIVWTGTLTVKKSDGTTALVAFMPDVDKNIQLQAVGASYGVRKLATDAPHWSLDGH
jgi:hypothetical protein